MPTPPRNAGIHLSMVPDVATDEDHFTFTNAPSDLRTRTPMSEFMSAVSPVSTPRSSGPPVSGNSRIDRSVASRTQFLITLPLSTVSSSSLSSSAVGDAAETAIDQRGWSSPHGEPYRPLGKPNLSLKFLPRLANGANLLQNAHRMKVFEGGTSKDGSSHDHDKTTSGSETRPAQPPTTNPSSTALSSPGLFDMFPLQFTHKKRPLDERQVKLAHRLHASVSQYSPDKVRGLRRTPFPSPVSESTATEDGALSDSPRTCSHHHGADAWSVDLLRQAVHECSSRLRAVKNGARLLAHVPTGEHVDLCVLQEEYHRDRALFLTAAHVPLASRGSGGRRIGLRRTEDDAGDAKPVHSPSAADDDDVYLPYTTRRAEQSPSFRHPTLSKVKATLRDEKLLRPLLSTQVVTGTGNAGADVIGRSSSLARQSVRLSRGSGSVLVSTTNHQRAHDRLSTIETTAHPLASSAAGVPTGLPSGRRASIVAVALPSPSNAVQTSDAVPPSLNSVNDLTAMARHALTRKLNADALHQQPKRHSVERLQAAVDAIEDAKAVHSQQLARAVGSLRETRCECLATKFQHWSLERDVTTDLHAMRHVAEHQRVERIAASVAHTAWYRDLLALLAARDDTVLHPAEVLLIRAVRRTTNAGRPFDRDLLFRLVLLLDRDDLRVPDVQQALAFLRHALRVSVDEWGAFCSAHALPVPTELAVQHEPVVPLHAHSHARVSMLHAIVTLNQAVRHFSRSGGGERDEPR